MTTAKRRLTNINFEQEGAHVALVGPSVGGPANGVTTLVTKATSAITPELVEKASNVTVTMQFTDFLRRFFCMYWEDAEVLSMALGYGQTEDFDWENATYQEYLDSQVASINIMKAAYSAQDVQKALSEVSPEDMVQMLLDQETIEKAMSSGLPSGENLNNHSVKIEDHSMETILNSAAEEMVTKAVAAAVEPVQKALDEQAVVLKAANEKIEAFELAAAEAVAKARKEQLTAVAPADQVEELFKSTAPLDDAAFAVVIKSLETAMKSADASDAFQELGLNGQGEQDPKKVDGTAAILKAKFQPNK